MIYGREYDVAVCDLEDDLVGTDKYPNKAATGDRLIQAIISTAERYGLREKSLARAAYKRWMSLLSPSKQTTRFLRELEMLIVHPTRLLESSDVTVKMTPKMLRSLVKEATLPKTSKHYDNGWTDAINGSPPGPPAMHRQEAIDEYMDGYQDGIDHIGRYDEPVDFDPLGDAGSPVVGTGPDGRPRRKRLGESRSFYRQKRDLLRDFLSQLTKAEHVLTQVMDLDEDTPAGPDEDVQSLMQGLLDLMNFGESLHDAVDVMTDD